MKIDELKVTVEKYRAEMKDKGGRVVVSSESGPVGMQLIDALVACIEAQDRKIAEMQKSIDTLRVARAG